jgi:hypothetical protein
MKRAIFAESSLGFLALEASTSPPSGDSKADDLAFRFWRMASRKLDRNAIAFPDGSDLFAESHGF